MIFIVWKVRGGERNMARLKRRIAKRRKTVRRRVKKRRATVKRRIKRRRGR